AVVFRRVYSGSSGTETDDRFGSDFRHFAIDDDLIPTPLRAERDRRKVEIVAARKRGGWRSLAVFLALIAYLIRYRINLWIHKDADERNAKELRALFEHFGGLWVKLGQLLSLRTDMFSDAMC